jgi:ParB family chromosome partitioning protein
MAAERRRGLGRGLDSLIPGQEGPNASAGFIQADIDTLSPNPLQPRVDWASDELSALAQSIAEHGVIQPILVTAVAGPTPYQILAGERRWRAARQAGLRSVPILVREAAGVQLLELALVENIHRADLNPIEEALAYRQLIDEFGLTQSQVAERTAKSRPAVTNTLRLLDAPEEIRAAVVTGRVSAGHARALLGIPTRAGQLTALATVFEQGLNVRQTEELVRRMAEAANEDAKPKPSQPQRLQPELRGLQEQLQRAFSTKVDLRKGKRGGSIVIHFTSDDELTHILDRMGLVEPD